MPPNEPNQPVPTPMGAEEPFASARVARLEWLLQGVLEVQSLVARTELDLATFMEHSVELAAHLTGAQGAVIELVEGDEMVYRAVSTSLKQHLGLRLPRAGSLSGQCVAEAQTLRCADCEHDDRVNDEACGAVGVRSLICTPLFDAGQAVGVLKVLAGEPNAFDSDHQYLLGLLASALGSALSRQLTLDALKTSEETFRAAMETAPIGNALVKPDGRFLKVNAALCHLLGYNEEELLSNDIHSITHPDDRERNVEYAQRMISGEIEGYQLETRFYHRSGRTVWTQLSASLVRDSAGAPNYFVSQIQDISEQREMERVKSEFISIVSHELRTPLTSIRGSLGLVLGTHSDSIPPAVQRLLAIANNNCERLILLINDILDIDKIASGNMRFDMQERGIVDILHKAVQATEAYAQRFNVRLQLEQPELDARVVVDEDRLLQVLSNLLSNAVKFSPPDDVVTLTADIGERYVQLRVKDRGSGIPDEFRDRIFERFSQADSSATRRAGGTGLGLHISRQIVERMHGRIGFDSGIERGTTFWVEFPRATPSMNVVIEPSSLVIGNRLPQILHVENDRDLAEVVKTSLQGVADPVLATTLAQARRLLSTHSFAMALLDVCLPDGSGLDLLTEIEAMGERAPPVVLLCADAPSHDLRGRVAAVMIKTRLPESRVVETIARILNQQRGAAPSASPS